MTEPEALVRAYLDAMERRDLAAAAAMLGEGFEMSFPGTPPMRGLQELIDWAAPRYRFVKKSYVGFDVMEAPRAAAVVYARGALSGEWPDGAAFEGVRFIDRFEITGGKIVRQDVWNDIGEARGGVSR